MLYITFKFYIKNHSASKMAISESMDASEISADNLPFTSQSTLKANQPSANSHPLYSQSNSTHQL